TSSAQLAGSSDAPPTSTPSSSGSASSSVMFLRFTLPPYSTRARSPTPRAASHARISRCTPAASWGVAFLPVPIAHTGSYAIVIWASLPPSRPRSAPASCRCTTASVCPPSRSASVSPTHRTGARPAPRAAATFLRVSSSVSPKMWRRSEWPTRVAFAPAWATRGPDTAPVRAPFGSQWMSWAPITRSVRSSPRVERRRLEHAHGPVPEDSLGLDDPGPEVELGGLIDVEHGAVGRDAVARHLAPLGGALEARGDDRAAGQNQLRAGPGDDGLSDVVLVAVHERAAHADADRGIVVFFSRPKARVLDQRDAHPRKPPRHSSAGPRIGDELDRGAEQPLEIACDLPQRQLGVGACGAA